MSDNTHGNTDRITVREVTTPNEKSYICNEVLRALPSWFGIESSIVDYVEKVASLPFYAAFDNGKGVGFLAIKVHNPFTAEVLVMGIMKEYHRQGIGKKLMEGCEGFCRQNRLEFLTVKTLDESRESQSYSKTRLYYQSMGFKPLEVFPLLWDENNPCLFMAKSIGI